MRAKHATPLPGLWSVIDNRKQVEVEWLEMRVGNVGKTSLLSSWHFCEAWLSSLGPLRSCLIAFCPSGFSCYVQKICSGASCSPCAFGPVLRSWKGLLIYFREQQHSVQGQLFCVRRGRGKWGGGYNFSSWSPVSLRIKTALTIANLPEILKNMQETVTFLFIVSKAGPVERLSRNFILRTGNWRPNLVPRFFPSHVGPWNQGTPALLLHQHTPSVWVFVSHLLLLES